MKTHPEHISYLKLRPITDALCKSCCILNQVCQLESLDQKCKLKIEAQTPLDMKTPDSVYSMLLPRRRLFQLFLSLFTQHLPRYLLDIMQTDPLDYSSLATQNWAHAPAPDLLPVPDDLRSPGDSLCIVCQLLNLTPRHFVVLPIDNQWTSQPDNPNINLGLARDILAKERCPFCRLVVNALGGADKVPIDEDGEPVSVTMSLNTEGVRPDVNNSSHHIPEIRVLKPYLQKQTGGYLRPGRYNFFREITLLANDSPSLSKTFFVRPINEKQIDFSMVQNWISLCERWHSAACNKSQLLGHSMTNPAAEIPSFRLIDVFQNCLVRAPQGCRYAALSYVWGRNPDFLKTLTGNVRKLEQPGAFLIPSFRDRIPMTIQDAMQVTREINMQYLWVDCLCIIQDDDSEGKTDAISKMDLVYGGAVLTIIAAAGVDANAGLPGVRPGTRGHRQPIEEITPGLRLGFKSRYENYLMSNDTVYHTRAWTYQEREFTKRSIIFIGGQVIFKCAANSEWREDVVCEDHRIVRAELRVPRSNDIGKFEGFIQEYSALALTYESDIYNAFAGFSRYFQVELQARLCHGIPDAYFDWFLLWIPTGSQTRRQKAPSWSWSGWVGASWPRIWDWYHRRIDMVNNALQQRTWIIWYHRISHTSVDCVRVLPLKKKKVSWLSAPKNFYGSPVQNRFSFDCKQTIPTHKILNGAPVYYPDTLNPTPGSGFLQFWTVSVLFDLKPNASKGAPVGHNDGLPRIGFFGRDGYEVGIVAVSDGWRDKNVPGKHEFILICEGRDERAEYDKVDVEPGWKYMVMLIEWHGQWAERVAIGSIEKQNLNQALGKGPIWK